MICGNSYISPKNATIRTARYNFLYKNFTRNTTNYLQSPITKYRNIESYVDYDLEKPMYTLSSQIAAK